MAEDTLEDKKAPTPKEQLEIADKEYVESLVSGGKIEKHEKQLLLRLIEGRRSIAGAVADIRNLKTPKDIPGAEKLIELEEKRELPEEFKHRLRGALQSEVLSESVYIEWGLEQMYNAGLEAGAWGTSTTHTHTDTEELFRIAQERVSIIREQALERMQVSTSQTGTEE